MNYFSGKAYALFSFLSWFHYCNIMFIKITYLVLIMACMNKILLSLCLNFNFKNKTMSKKSHMFHSYAKDNHLQLWNNAGTIKCRMNIYFLNHFTHVWHHKMFFEKFYAGSHTSFVRSIITKRSAFRKINWCSRTHFRAILSYMNLMARHLNQYHIHLVDINTMYIYFKVDKSCLFIIYSSLKKI